MSRQFINIGSSPNDGNGIPIRDAFDIVNNNFLDVYAGNISGVVKTNQTGNFLTSSQTGNFITINQTGGFLTAIPPVLTGGRTFVSSGVANVPVVLKGISGQTGDLLQAQDYTGKVWARISKTGDFFGNGANLLNVVNTTSNQTAINGTKTFRGDVNFQAPVNVNNDIQFNGYNLVNGPMVVFGSYPMFGKTSQKAVITSFTDVQAPILASAETPAISMTPSDGQSVSIYVITSSIGAAYNQTFYFRSFVSGPYDIDISSNDSTTIASNMAAAIYTWLFDTGTTSFFQVSVNDQGGANFTLKFEILLDMSYTGGVSITSDFLSSAFGSSIPSIPAQGTNRFEFGLSGPNFISIDKIMAHAEGSVPRIGNIDIGVRYADVDYPMFVILESTINDTSKSILTIGNGIDIVDFATYEQYQFGSYASASSIYVSNATSDSYDPTKRMVSVFLEIAVRH